MSSASVGRSLLACNDGAKIAAVDRLHGEYVRRYREQPTPEHREHLANVQQGSEEWFKARVFTASEFGSAVNAVIEGSGLRLLRQKVWGITKEEEENEERTRHLERGKLHEPTAALEFSKTPIGTLYDQRECGIFLDADVPALGASPDRLLYTKGSEDRDTVSALLEIKCPDPEKPVPDGYIGKVLWQTMGQMAIANVPVCYVYIWTQKHQRLYRVRFDPGFWRCLKTHLCTFLFDAMATQMILKDESLLEEGELEVMVPRMTAFLMRRQPDIQVLVQRSFSYYTELPTRIVPPSIIVVPVVTPPADTGSRKRRTDDRTCHPPINKHRHNTDG